MAKVSEIIMHELKGWQVKMTMIKFRTRQKCNLFYTN